MKCQFLDSLFAVNQGHFSSVTFCGLNYLKPVLLIIIYCSKKHIGCVLETEKQLAGTVLQQAKPPLETEYLHQSIVSGLDYS